MSTTKYVNAQVFTGETETVEQLDFVVDDETGRFVATTSAEHTVDLAGKYVTPGLINAHVHMVLDPYNREEVNENPVVDTATALENLQEALAAGVTYVRDMGSTFYTDLKLAELEAKGRLTLPGIVTSGPSLSMTGGHGSGFGLEVDGVDEVRKATRDNLKRGAKNIKLMATGGVSFDGEEPTDVQLDEADIQVAVVEAHRKRRTVAAHAQGTEGIKNAVRAGVDSVEHAIYMDEEAADMMLANGTTIVATLVAPWAINQHTDVLPEFMVKKSLAVAQAHLESMKLAVRKGVKMAMGTDAGTPYNDFREAVFQELLMLQEVGLTPSEVLRTATMASAELLQVAHEAGSIATGKLADFVVLDENPLENLTAFSRQRQVFKKGKLVFATEN